MNKLVYRYNDWNRTGDGHAEIRLDKRIVVKETECYLWHIPVPYGVEPETFEIPPGYGFSWTQFPYTGRVMKTRKGAFRSAWNETPEAALHAWRTRKAYQRKKLELQLERVQLCIEAYDHNQPWNIVPAVIHAGSGPVLEGYDWREY